MPTGPSGPLASRHDAAGIAGQPPGTGATALETTVQLHVDNARLVGIAITARVDLGFLPVLVAGGIVACAEAIRRGAVGAVGVRVLDGQPTA